MSKESEQLYLEAQRRMVASLLVSGSAGVNIVDVVNALQAVDANDFDDPALKLVFAAVSDLSKSDETISVFNVCSNLERAGNLERVGGKTAVQNLSYEGEDYLVESSLSRYARYLKEHSVKNKCSEVIKNSLKDFKADSGVLAKDVIASLQSALNEKLYVLSDETTISDMSDLKDEIFDKLEEREKVRLENLENAGGLQGIPTLLPTLDKQTSGFTGGQMIVVGAGTGVGKSAFAINCALAAGQANKSVMLFSLEMSKDEIQNRLISSSTMIPVNALKQGDVRNKDLLASGVDDLSNMKIVIDTEPNVTLDAIRAKALKQAQSRDGLDMIVIDYLQLIKPTSDVPRQQQIAEISRETKLLAKGLDIPIMVLSQLNRPRDGEEGLPDRNRLRESGAIANDADIILLLHREETHGDSIEDTLLIVDKNRNGPAGKIIRCHSDLACALFREKANSKESEGEDVDDDDLDFDDDFMSEEMDEIANDDSISHDDVWGDVD